MALIVLVLAFVSASEPVASVPVASVPVASVPVDSEPVVKLQVKH